MDLASMVVKFAENISSPAWRFIWLIAAFIGMYFFGAAIAKMQKASLNPGHARVGISDILPILIIGALLLNLSMFINSVWNTMSTGTVDYSPVSYGGAEGFGRMSDAINAVLTIARVAGGFFSLRGMLFFKKAASGDSSSGDAVARGFTHLIGGACLIQIPDMIERFRQSFGLYW